MFVVLLTEVRRILTNILKSIFSNLSEKAPQNIDVNINKVILLKNFFINIKNKRYTYSLINTI